jgi:hypothetical protein
LKRNVKERRTEDSGAFDCGIDGQIERQRPDTGKNTLIGYRKTLPVICSTGRSCLDAFYVPLKAITVDDGVVRMA